MIGRRLSGASARFLSHGFRPVALPVLCSQVWRAHHIVYAPADGSSAQGVAGQYCLTQAFRYAEAAAIAPLGYLSMVLALQGYLVWNNISAPCVVGGTALVVASGFLFLYPERHLS